MWLGRSINARFRRAWGPHFRIPPPGSFLGFSFFHQRKKRREERKKRVLVPTPNQTISTLSGSRGNHRVNRPPHHHTTTSHEQLISSFYINQHDPAPQTPPVPYRFIRALRRLIPHHTKPNQPESSASIGNDDENALGSLRERLGWSESVCILMADAIPHHVIRSFLSAKETSTQHTIH